VWGFFNIPVGSPKKSILKSDKCKIDHTLWCTYMSDLTVKSDQSTYPITVIHLNWGNPCKIKCQVCSFKRFSQFSHLVKAVVNEITSPNNGRQQNLVTYILIAVYWKLRQWEFLVRNIISELFVMGKVQFCDILTKWARAVCPVKKRNKQQLAFMQIEIRDFACENIKRTLLLTQTRYLT